MPTGVVLDVAVEVWQHNKVVIVSCGSCEHLGDTFSLVGEMQLINKIKTLLHNKYCLIYIAYKFDMLIMTVV